MKASNAVDVVRTSDVLMQPVKLGALELKHRVLMAPLTRSRATWPGLIPNDLMARYYEQRASECGLIIGEATNISKTAIGWYGSPGLYSDEQVEGWKTILDRVHSKGGLMLTQLWHTGRASHISLREGSDPVSASVNPSYWHLDTQLISTPGGWLQPSPHRALTVPEIKQIIEDYSAAAKRAKDAGFDGIELHAANGYLIDQFLQDGTNQRTDEYGGAIENRIRLLVEVIEALLSIWPSNRVGVRIAPGSIFNQMHDSDPIALFTGAAMRLSHFSLAYLHVVEPRIRGKALLEGDSLESGLLAVEVIHRHVKPVAEKLGIDRTVDFRSFRTMHASLMRRYGARLEVARDNMGHSGSTGSITLDVYSKTWWNERVDAISRVVEAVFAEPDEEEKKSVTPQKGLPTGGEGEEWEPFWEPQAV